MTVRTPETPLVFTWRERWRAAWSVWAVVMVLVVALAILAVLFGQRLGAPDGFVLVAVPVVFSAVVVTALAPLCWGLGKLLQHVPHPALHIAAFFGLGVVIGVGVVLVITGGDVGQRLLNPFAFVVGGLLGTILAVGWTVTWLRARRADAGRAGAVQPASSSAIS